jgi:drug/metabolite transporter (DMT)-like permease
VVLAFAAVYLVWGSTYLAIRIALETMPPFLMAGVRFVVAGGILYLWARLRGAPGPTRAQLGPAVVVGGLMLLGGNGGVVWSEQYVPSGIAALLIAMTPVWMVLLAWLSPGGARPPYGVLAGVVTGFLGMLFLVDPARLGGGERIHLGAAAALVLASLAWSVGSLYSRRAKLPPSPLMAIACEMLGGGVLLLGAALLTGEGRLIAGLDVSARSLLAHAYLIVFGSLVGFSAYIWLLRVTTPARAATYAYVNPVVALVLGHALGGEALGGRTIAGAAVILASVVVIAVARSRGASVAVTVTAPRPAPEPAGGGAMVQRAAR